MIIFSDTFRCEVGGDSLIYLTFVFYVKLLDGQNARASVQRFTTTKAVEIATLVPQKSIIKV